MITIRILSTPTNIETLASRGPAILERIRAKITALMIALQAKAVGETIPELFPNGAPNIAATVRAVPAEIQGTKVSGYVDAGGPRTTKQTLSTGAVVDYAAVQHAGIPHGFTIRPFNKKALAFMLDGKKVIVKSVHHPGLKARPFLTLTLERMQEQIVAELSAELTAIVNG